MEAEEEGEGEERSRREGERRVRALWEEVASRGLKRTVQKQGKQKKQKNQKKDGKKVGNLHTLQNQGGIREDEEEAEEVGQKDIDGNMVRAKPFKGSSSSNGNAGAMRGSSKASTDGLGSSHVGSVGMMMKKKRRQGRRKGSFVGFPPL